MAAGKPRNPSLSIAPRTASGSSTIWLWALLLPALVLVACRLTTPAATPIPTAVPPSPTPLPTATLPPPSPTPSPPPSPTPPAPPGTPAPLSTDPALYAPAMRPAFAADVTHFLTGTLYAIDLTLTFDPPQVEGRQWVRYINQEQVPLTELYLRLFPNTPAYGGQMQVTELTLNGQAVEPVTELEGSALRLPLDPPLPPGQAVTLTMAFQVTVPEETTAGYGQFSYSEGVMALPNVYPLIPVYDDEGWNVEIAPAIGDAVYSDTALYRVWVTAPARTQIATSGTCGPPRPLDGDRARWTCVSGPMRDFVVIAGPDYQVLSTQVDGVQVNSYFLPGDEAGGRQVLETAAAALRDFDRWFGPYPFAELDVVETPTTAGGIEYPGLVVIAEDLYGGSRGRFDFFRWATAHEVAHQWWYSLVGNDQVDEPWLDEALAQYSTYLFFEDVEGEEEAERIKEVYFEEPYQAVVQAGEDQPVGQPVSAFSPEGYGLIVYQKGPLFFDALRQAAGDEGFLTILRTYFRQNRYGIATPEALLAAARQVLGEEEVQALYEAWILK